MRTTTMTNHGRLIFRPVMIITLLIMMLVAPQQEAAAKSFGSPPPELDPGPPRVDLKMAIVMVLLVTVFFILGFLSVYTRQCANGRFRGRADPGFGPSPAGWATSRGLDPDFIDTFPTFVYSTVKEHKLGKGALECAVCLNEFEDNETLRLIPKCDHVFHPDCIDSWLVSHSTCPVCRANLTPKPGEAHKTLGDILNPVHGPVREEFTSVIVEEPIRAVAMRDEESPEVHLIGRGSQSRPPRSRSTGFGQAARRLGGIFQRSHSTGHSLVRPGESQERFTLRLPVEVRSQLVKSTLERAKSAGAGLPRVGSARRGYRSGSRREGLSYNQRFDPETRVADRWVFSVVPPFVSRTGSFRSGSKGMGGDDVASRPKAGSSETEKPPPVCSLIGQDDVGERSSDPLRPGNDV